MTRKTENIVIVHQPACSSVLFIKKGKITILRQSTATIAKAFAQGFIQGRSTARYEDEIELPVGSPVILYRDVMNSETVA